MTLTLLGYLAAFSIGIILSLFGSGGSLLALPALVYLFAIPASEANTYSLLIVAITAAASLFFYIKKKEVAIRTAIIFATSSIPTVWLTKVYILPNLPSQIRVLETTFSKDSYIMILFGLSLFLATILLFTKKPSASTSSNTNVILMIAGIIVGLFTGVLGSGGGFFIVPALLLSTRLPMNTIIGTSLLLVVTNTLFGFLLSLKVTHLDFNWAIIGLFLLFSLTGTQVGRLLNLNLPEKIKRRIFAAITVSIGTLILLKEIL
jgi:uncharacterized membrane protein YfcA